MFGLQGRFDRDRVGRGDGFRGRGPPPGPGYGPPDDFNARGGYGGGKFFMTLVVLTVVLLGLIPEDLPINFDDRLCA